VGVGSYLHGRALGGRSKGGVSGNGWDVESAPFRTFMCICRVHSIAVDTAGRMVTGSRIGAVFFATGGALGSVGILRVLVTTNATFGRGSAVGDEMT
jgi:hypothetical protein